MHDKVTKPSQKPRRICRKDCELIENKLCPLEYALAKRNALVKQVMQDCSELPLSGTPDDEGCLSLNIPSAETTVQGIYFLLTTSKRFLVLYKYKILYYVVFLFSFQLFRKTLCHTYWVWQVFWFSSFLWQLIYAVVGVELQHKADFQIAVGARYTNCLSMLNNT